MKKNKNVMTKTQFERVVKLASKLSTLLTSFELPKSKKVYTKKVEPKNQEEASKRVCAISMKNNRKRYFKSLSECSAKLSIDVANMSKAIRGKRKSAGGYRFEYVD